MLEIGALTVAYGQHRALEDAALTVGRGEIVVILGANGAGKSTLLRAVAGICEGRVTGTVTLRGEALTGLPPDRIVEAGVALVPEGRGVFGELSVRENLVLGAYSDRARDDQASNLDRVLALFPRLAERPRQRVATMSGGEQQMVAIGRAMMSAPDILMLDEPSLGLSPLLSKGLFASLRTVRGAGIGILLVEQNAKASLAIADRGYLLENGRITQGAPAAALAGDPAVQAAYLGGAPKAGPKTPAPAPRPPAGPNPSDIAAAAMARLPSAPARPASKAPPPRPAAPGPAPAAPRSAPPPPPVAGAVRGIDLGDLVARAADTSRLSVRSSRTAARRSAPIPDPRSAPRPATPKIDTDSRTRLTEILTEIEDAARRAEAWRPGSRR